MEKRETKYDNIKGILILLVVFGHFLIDYHNYYSNTLACIIYVFHMALFSFISGYFTNKKTKIYNLIYHYLIFNLIYLETGYLINKSSISLIYPAYSSWYLISLFIWRLLYKHIKINKKTIILNIILSLLVGFTKINNIFAISRTIYFSTFFMIGVLYKENKFKFKNSKLFIIPIIITLILILLRIINIDILTIMSYKNIYDVLIRMLLIFTSVIIINYFIKYTSNNKLPLITNFGINSLSIFLLHRPLVLLINKFISPTVNSFILILVSFLFSILLSFILSKLNFIFKYLNKLLDFMDITKDGFKKSFSNGKLLLNLMFIVIIFSVIYALPNSTNKIEKKDKEEKYDIRMSYIGDLILLKRQIDKNNDYDYIFNDTKDILKESDYTFAVLEGPVSRGSYSNSNFDDNVRYLKLNYPVSFLDSIRKSGIDMVTIANNHILDKEVSGLKDTIKNLKKKKINYTGGYLNKEDKEENKIKIINIKGVRVGILSYTYGINYKNNKDYTYATSYLEDPESVNFYKTKKNVLNDINNLKKKNPDLIIVMAHMGEQFNHNTNYYQNIWNKIFSENDVSIVLGDHAHTAEQVEYIGNTLVVNCPGNFINSYTKYDGDKSSIVNIYYRKKDKKIFSSIVPIYITKENKKYVTKKARSISKYDKDYKNINKANKIVISNMLNIDENINESTGAYFKDKNKIYKVNKTKIDNISNNHIYKLFEDNKNITFIGDSITNGYGNGGYGYYVPIINYFNSTGNKKNVCKKGFDSATTYDLLTKNLNCKNFNADLYVIAIGANNIRYKLESAKSYIKSLDKVINKMDTNKNILIVAPFPSTNYDKIVLIQVKRINFIKNTIKY